MKPRLILFVVYLLFITTAAHAQSWKWAKGVGGDETEGYYSSSDRYGGVFVSGISWGDIVLPAFTLRHPGVVSAYLIKYDTAGNVVWANTTTAGTAYPLGISTDVFGDVYVLGAYDSLVNVSGQLLHNSHPAPNQLYVAKYAPDGTLIWARNLGNVSASNYVAGGIKTDPTGNIYIAANFYGNPILGPYTFTNSDTANRTDDIFVAKFDSSGTVLWAKTFGGTKHEYLSGSIAVSNSGSAFIGGYYASDRLIFGSDTLFNIGTVPNHNATFLAKIDKYGNPKWCRGAGGRSAYNYGFGIVTDINEDVYFTGSFFGDTLVFGADTIRPSGPRLNGYLVKYDSTGRALWTKQMKGSSIMNFALATDACQNIWLTGGIQAAMVDTIDGHEVNPPADSYDPMYLAGWTPSGAFLHALTLSSGGDDLSSLCTDQCGNVYVEGDYEHVNPFILGSVSIIPPVSAELNFLAKYATGVGCECLPVSAMQVASEFSVNLFPNPAQNVVTVAATENIERLVVVDPLGRVLMERHNVPKSIMLDITDLAVGIYYVRINNTTVKRFVKY